MNARRRTLDADAFGAARLVAALGALASAAPGAARAADGASERRAGEVAVAAVGAEAKGPDTTYGRIDGDVAVAAGVGATLAPHGARAAVDLRLRYIETVGVFAGYEEGGFNTSMDPRRVIAGGVEIRPLFIARWLNGAEWGSPRADLTLDSLGLEVGAFVAQPLGGSFASRPGLQLGLGVETPIFARAAGPWVGFHGGARWSDSVVGGSTVTGPSDRSLFLTVTLSWHAYVGAHVVDMGDRAPR